MLFRSTASAAASFTELTLSAAACAEAAEDDAELAEAVADVAAFAAVNASAAAACAKAATWSAFSSVIPDCVVTVSAAAITSDAALLMPGMTPELSSLTIVLIWFMDVRTVASSVACTFRKGHGSTGVNVGIGIFDSPRLNKTLYVYRYLLFIWAAVHATPILNPPIHCQGVVAIVSIVAYPDTRLGPQ